MVVPDFADLKGNEAALKLTRALSVGDPTGENLGVANVIEGHVQLEYKRLIASGVSTDHDDAVKTAVDNVINKNFSLTNNKVPLPIPKNLEADPDSIEDFVDATKRASGFNRFAEQFDIQPPEGFPGTREQYLNEIKETSQWVWDGADGAELMEITKAGAPARVLGKTGQPIRVKYKDMNESLFKYRGTREHIITGMQVKF